MSERRFSIALLFAFFVGCGPSPTAKKNVIAPPRATSTEDKNFRVLRKSLESTVIENYAQFGFLGGDGIAAEREVHLIGLTPDAIIAGEKPAKPENALRLYQDRNPRIFTKNLEVHLSEDGYVGWVYDEISYRVEHLEREAAIPIRVTAVYVRDVDRWVVVSEHWSYGIPMAEIRALAATEKFVSGPMIAGGLNEESEISKSVRTVVDRFVRDGNGLAARGEALAIFSGPMQEYRGGTKAEVLRLVNESNAVVRVLVQNARVQFASSQAVAWAIANIRVSLENDGELSQVYLRGSFVLERRRRKQWDIVQAHLSAPLTQSYLDRAVFGAILENAP